LRVCRWNFSRDVYPSTWQEIIPELVYGAALFIIAILGIISHFRFKRLIYQTRDSTNGKSITNKISYFKDLNFLLTICLLIDGACFIILSADGLTSKLKCSRLYIVAWMLIDKFPIIYSRPIFEQPQVSGTTSMKQHGSARSY
jgi:hypothetical protein